MSRQAQAALLCASLLGASTVHAGGRAAAPEAAAEDPSRVAARRAYEKGVEYFRQKRFGDAVREFNKAYRLDPNPVLVFNMARAFEELKDYGPAIEFYRKYLAMAPQAEDRRQVEETIRTLEILRRRSEAEARVPLTVVSTPDGAQVLIDGRPAGVTPLKTEIAAGTHFLSIEKDGFARSSFEIEAKPDAPVRREVQLVPAAERGPGERPDRTWAWVAVGAGGALIAGGAIAGAQALKKHEKINDIIEGRAEADEAEFDALRDEGARFALIADGLYVAGAASLVTGVVLFLMGDDEPSTRATVRPGPGGAGVDLAVSF